MVYAKHLLEGERVMLRYLASDLGAGITGELQALVMGY